MQQIALEIVLIFVLLLINALFSMSEIAVISARKLRLQNRAENGDQGARVALELAATPGRFLSTVQIGITLVGVLAGAFGGAGVARYLSELLQSLSIPESYSQSISFGVVVALITYFSVVVGELIPKSIALNYPETIAAAVSRPMRLLSNGAAPVVWLLSAPTGFILRLFKVHAVVEPPVTDDEIKGLIAQGTEAGVFEESEQELLESIIHLDDKGVTSLMTPRMEVTWLDLESQTPVQWETIVNSTYSRFPVGRGSLDNVVGYASAKDLLKRMLDGEGFDLEKTIKQPLYVPETITALELLEKFKASETHLAVIVDEYGATAGLVTMNDVLEAIVGDAGGTENIQKSDENFGRQPDGSFLLDGRTSIAELIEILELKELTVEERSGYQTLAGFVLKHLGKLPREKDEFEANGYRFEVAGMQRKRVTRVRARKIKNEAEDATMTKMSQSSS